MILVVGIYLASSTLFIHHHTINGVVVVHSHPFLGSNTAHSHSDSSIDTIYRLTMPNALVDNSTIELTCTMHTIVTSEGYVSTATHTSEQNTYLLRAPPARA